MKRTYISPKTEIVRVQTATIIAASPALGASTEELGLEDVQYSRRGGSSFWDDEE